MKIILIHKAKLVISPPVISVLAHLQHSGHELTLINTGINEHWRKRLGKQGVHFHIIPDIDFAGVLGKMVSYMRFRRRALAIIREQFPKGDEGILWIEGAYTLVALGTAIRRFSYILQIQELHEKFKYQLKAIGRVIHDAKVVFMPEYNRTALYQVWFGLKKRPRVLPNKPYFLPSEEELAALKVKYAQYLNLFRENKVVLYQGHISPDRDLSAYVRAIKSLGSEYKLVLLGKDHGMVEKYRRIDSNLQHIHFIPAPDYLLFTSLAHIGILCYSPISENNIYCAPNKIFEYTAYGLPMLGNDIPGLRYTIQEHGLGKIVDENNELSIATAIQELDMRHEEYKEAAKKFFLMTDNQLTIDTALQEAVEG